MTKKIKSLITIAAFIAVIYYGAFAGKNWARNLILAYNGFLVLTWFGLEKIKADAWEKIATGKGNKPQGLGWLRFINLVEAGYVVAFVMAGWFASAFIWASTSILIAGFRQEYRKRWDAHTVAGAMGFIAQSRFLSDEMSGFFSKS